MYGLILENLSEFIKQTYGEEKWEEIRRASSVDQPSFSTHQVYPEALIPKLAKKAMQILEVSENEFFDQMGVFFIGFVSQYGYDRVLSVLGRHMRDFLNGLDNLHEYLKFSYPRMRAPSFICENETRQGLTLHYRSKRRGFVYYTMGQIREVARHFYQKDMKIELIREEILFDMIHVTFQCTFDNRAFTMASLVMTREEKHLPISASALFEIFPFCIVFGSDMTVRSIGNSLMVILPDVIGKKITTWFDLVRPLIEFKFQTILNRTNNIFELVSVEPVLNDKSGNEKSRLDVILNDEELPEDRNLRLKGQMIYMDNWKMMMYLGTPVMPDLNSLINSGLYINDLSMHDFSRDLMLAGTQQSVELKLALDQEQQKSKKLEESMRKLDEEMRRTDELLYQMIPKQVAVRLRTGENPIDTCEMFDSVSILFSDVVTFTEICSRITPMEVVSMLNGMYSIFDNLTERNNVYKVETIGDAYMVVSGAPEKQGNHAERVCDMALDMVDAIMNLKDPSTDQHLQIRVGVHSGAVVAGIVGLKMPRYCLFGDSVNTASRMESTSSAMQIHISQSTKELLPESYSVLERGEINVKGKGSMKTYWLNGKDSRRPLPQTTTSTSTASTKTPRDVIKLGEREVTSSRSPSIISITADRNTIARLSAEGIKQVYSPITFQDVARRSIVSSPVTSPGKESRSNSTPAQSVSVSTVGPRDPSSIFGCPTCSPDEDSSSSSSGDDYQLPAASLLQTLPPPHSSSSTDSLSRPISPRYQKTTVVATPLAIHHVIVDGDSVRGVDSVSQSRKNDKVSLTSRVSNVGAGKVSLGRNEVKIDGGRNKVSPVDVGDRNTAAGKVASSNKSSTGAKGKIAEDKNASVISCNNKKGNTVSKSRDKNTNCGHTDTVTNPNPNPTKTDNKLTTTIVDGASVNLLLPCPATTAITANSTGTNDDDMDLLGLGFPACAAMFSGVARAAAAHKKHKHGRQSKAPLRHAEGCTRAQQVSDCTDGGVVQQQLQAHYAAGFRGNVNSAGEQLPPCCIATKNRFHTSACHLM